LSVDNERGTMLLLNRPFVATNFDGYVLASTAIKFSMPDRYYSAEPIDGSTVTLADSEAHHLLHVMRAKPGFELIVFDGQGGEFAAEVVECKRSTIDLTIGPRQNIERELPYELTLAVSLPKGDRQHWLLEKCVELGVTRLVPLQTTRSVGKGDIGSKSEPNKKFARYVIEASKQCGRNRLMEIASPIAWPALVAETTSGQCLLAHPGGQPLIEIKLQTNEGTKLLLAIGPEGGFTDEEVSQAVGAGWETVGLGARILRIETAAVALISALTNNRSQKKEKAADERR